LKKRADNKPVDDLEKLPADTIALEKLDMVIAHLSRLREEQDIDPIVDSLYECFFGCEECSKILDDWSKTPNQEIGLTKIEFLILELQRRQNDAATDFVWRKLKSSNEDVLISKKKMNSKAKE
jgi:hypothetical protein